MDKILTFLELQKQSAQAPDLKSFEFIALNQTNSLVPYKQAIFWVKTDFGIRLSEVSGNISLDQNGPYAQWLKAFVQKTALPASQDSSVCLFSHDTLDQAHISDWEEYAGAHGALIVFKTMQEGISGGLWLEREKAFNEAEQATLGELAQLYSQTYALLNLRQKSRLFSPWKNMQKHHKLLMIGLILLCLFPVRLTLSGPAEIVAQNPTVVTVPYDGVLDEITVKPGDQVTQGQSVFTMDRTDLDGKIEASAQALKTARANLSRLRKESLSAPEKKAELHTLLSDIAAKKIEHDYARKRLEKSEVHSPVDGVAIFSDANQFEGQPLRTGEKIMIVADSNDIELLIKAPVNSMIPITKESAIAFYLNVAPLKGYSAQVISMGYQASPDPDGLLTYKIRARIDMDGKKNQNTLRIGWKGTAKVKGSWSVLGYAAMRRPLIALRNITGL